jgi:hypothetical protein
VRRRPGRATPPRRSQLTRIPGRVPVAATRSASRACAQPPAARPPVRAWQEGSPSGEDQVTDARCGYEGARGAQRPRTAGKGRSRGGGRDTRG